LWIRTQSRILRMKKASLLAWGVKLLGKMWCVFLSLFQWNPFNLIPVKTYRVKFFAWYVENVDLVFEIVSLKWKFEKLNHFDPFESTCFLDPVASFWICWRFYLKEKKSPVFGSWPFESQVFCIGVKGHAICRGEKSKRNLCFSNVWEKSLCGRLQCLKSLDSQDMSVWWQFSWPFFGRLVKSYLFFKESFRFICSNNSEFVWREFESSLCSFGFEL